MTENETKTVWKYVINKNFGVAKMVTMPKGSNILRVGIQNREVCFWACVIPAKCDNDKEDRTFFYTGTGHPVPLNASYIGGCSDEEFEWHVWELK